VSSPPPSAPAGPDALGPPPPPPGTPAPRSDPAEPRPESERSGLAAVPAWAALLATAFAIVIVPSLALLPVGVLELAGVDVDLTESPPGFVVPATLLLDAGLIGVAYAVARLFRVAVRPSTLGLRLAPVGRALLWTGAVYAAFWVATIAYSLVLGSPPEQDLVDELRSERSVVVLAAFALMVGVAAPLAEEVFFRGFLFGVLRERIGVLAAALVAGAIFGVIHAAGTPVRTLGILVLLGIGLCFLYVKTGSLLPCIGLHAFHNSISFAFTTKPDPAIGLLIVAGSVGVSLGVARAFAVRSARSAPAPA